MTADADAGADLKQAAGWGPERQAVEARREALRAEVARVLEPFDLDYWRAMDKAESHPQAFVDACIAAGWHGAIIPPEYGGAGWNVSDAAVLLGAVAESGAGTSGASPLHLAFFAPLPIIRHGTEELKAELLPALAKGERLLSFGVTEADAGIDTSRIQSIAERRGGRWVLHGSKAWLSNGANTQHALLLVRTAPRDPEKPLMGMTLFCVELDERTCELTYIDKLGRNAAGSWSIRFEGLEATEEQVVGEVGRGFYHLLDGLNPERIVIATEAIGIGRKALELATDYARERVVFDAPIGSRQGIAHPLARAWADLRAAELLALEAAARYDAGLSCGAEANAAKLLASEAGFNAADAAMQTFGGRGYAKEWHIERLWREVRLYRIVPITQEMVLNYLAEHVLDLPKSY